MSQAQESSEGDKSEQKFSTGMCENVYFEELKLELDNPSNLSPRETGNLDDLKLEFDIPKLSSAETYENLDLDVPQQPIAPNNFISQDVYGTCSRKKAMKLVDSTEHNTVGRNLSAKSSKKRKQTDLKRKYSKRQKSSHLSVTDVNGLNFDGSLVSPINNSNLNVANNLVVPFPLPSPCISNSLFATPLNTNNGVLINVGDNYSNISSPMNPVVLYPQIQTSNGLNFLTYTGFVTNYTSGISVAQPSNLIPNTISNNDASPSQNFENQQPVPADNSAKISEKPVEHDIAQPRIDATINSTTVNEEPIKHDDVVQSQLDVTDTFQLVTEKANEHAIDQPQSDVTEAESENPELTNISVLTSNKTEESNIENLIDTSSDSEIEEIDAEESDGKSSKSESSEDECEIAWDDECTVPPRSFYFDDVASGIKRDSGIASATREVEYFEYFFDHVIIEEIVNQTNAYHHEMSLKKDFKISSRNKQWKDVSMREMYVYIALSMLMAFAKKHCVTDYWKKDGLLPTPIFGKSMARNRFLLISTFLHLGAKKEGDNVSPIHKMGIVFDYIKDKIRQVFTPFQNIVIDESLVPFKGRLFFKQFLPSKKARFGLKLYILCDCRTGIILDLILYTGRHTNINKCDPLGTPAAIVKKLVFDYLGKGHVLYADNWYSSPRLCEYLLEKNTGYCGTVRFNRKGMPKFTEKLPRGGIEVKQKNNVLAIKWNDTRNVYMLTTVHDGKLISSGKYNYKRGGLIKKPNAVIDYNKNMLLIDKSDAQINSVTCMRTFKKWYKKLLLHLVDIAQYNAYNLYKFNTNSKVSFREFVYEVIEQLLHDYKAPKPSACNVPDNSCRDIRLESKACISKHHLVSAPVNVKGKAVIRQCHACSRARMNAGGRMKRVTTWCKGCQVPLCAIPCFLKYHTKKIW